MTAKKEWNWKKDLIWIILCLIMLICGIGIGVNMEYNYLISNMDTAQIQNLCRFLV